MERFNITTNRNIKINKMFKLKSYDEFLLESLQKTVGIKQAQVKSTIEHIKETLLSLFRLSEESIAFVGSAGKRSGEGTLSFNINLGLNHKKLLEANKLDEEELFEFFEKQLKRIGYKCHILEESNQIHVNWPIDGKENNGEIEVRFKLTENLDWLKFSRHSPIEGEESKYHSKYRQAFFEAIAETIKSDITEYFDTKDVVKEYELYELDIEDGLHTISRSFIGKNGILKKSIPLIETKKLVTSDPTEFAGILFGKGTKPEDVMTLESCMEIVNSDTYPYKKKRKRIFEAFKRKLVGSRLEIPKEIK